MIKIPKSTSFLKKTNRKHYKPSEAAVYAVNQERKKAGETNHHKDLPQKSTKKQTTRYLQYMDMLTMQTRPVPEAFIDKISQELVDWSKHPDSLKLGQFCVLKGLPWSTFQEWRHKYPQLKYAAEFAKLAIGSRREIGAIKKEYDTGMVKSSMHFYDEDWRKAEEWRASLRSPEQEQSSGEKIIVIEKFKKDS